MKNPDIAIVTPEARGVLARMLRTALRNRYREILMVKKDQGKTTMLIAKYPSSNHFTAGGKYTRFCDWRFIFRARLGVLPLNGTRRWGDGPKSCRVCQTQVETIPHVLNHCMRHADAMQKRHNSVQDRLVAAIPRRIKDNPTVNITINRKPIQGAGEAQVRPDIVIVDDTSKTVRIVDVTCPFESGEHAFVIARRRKEEVYQPTAERFREMGYTVTVDGFVVGSLGAWDPKNETVLRTMGISKRYAATMRRLMTSDCIKWSRDIYTEHVTGHGQYVE